MKPAGIPGRSSVGCGAVCGLIFLLVALALVGCIGGPGASRADQTEDDVQHEPFDDLRGGRGGVLGRVVTPNGTPVRDATVAVRNETASTDANGTFRVGDLRPGTAEMTVRHPRYQPASRRVDIREGMVVEVRVQLTPLDFEALWDGRRTLTLVNRSEPWHDNGTARDVYGIATQTYLAECYDEDSGRVYPYPNHRIRLDEDSGLILPGTDRMQVTLDWSDTDYRGDSLVLAYRAPGRAGFKESPYIAKGESFSLDVSAGMWDDPERNRTAWRVWLCTARADDWVPTSEDYRPWPFVGEVSIRMELIRETNSGAKEAPR